MWGVGGGRGIYLIELLTIFGIIDIFYYPFRKKCGFFLCQEMFFNILVGIKNQAVKLFF